MIKKTVFTLIALLISLMAACAAEAGKPVATHGKPGKVVTITSDAPKQITEGDTYQTTITITAIRDIEHLVIRLAPYKGLDITGSGHEREFYQLSRGDSRDFAVDTQITAEEVAYLSIFITTKDIVGNNITSSSMIRYGSVGEKTMKKMRSPTVDSSGERLILMPGHEVN